MAYLRKRGRTWTAELYRHGKREHATFRTKAEAAAWALEREAELTGARLPDRTLADALARYGREKVPESDAAARWQRNKLRNLLGYPIAAKPLAALSTPDFAAYRDARLGAAYLKGAGTVKASTVNRELNLLRSVLEAARKDWGWLRSNPMADLKRPKNPRSRRRRIEPDEIAAILAGLGYVGGPPQSLAHYTALAFLFALETAMRGGEIVRLQWAHVGAKSVFIPKSKNGDARHVPLSTRAREILALFPNDGRPVFRLNDHQRDGQFRKGRDAAGVADLHFHDSRAEGIYRLSKKLDVLELARVIGHRNVNSLLFYYDSTADELAAKLE